jgi:uncharacterized protein involved in outer membrane biogenesis
MKKLLKAIVVIVLSIVVLTVVALLALPLWIGPVVKGVANVAVPQITGTGFNLGEFGLNPYVGTLHVGDMQLANPTNFSEKNAVTLGKFDADLAVTSLFGGKKIRIESVDLDGLVVYSDTTASNFRQIAANAAGEPEEKSEVAKLAEENAPAEEPKAEEAKPAEEAKEGKGLQIDRITIKNVTVKYGIVPFEIPMDIEITDIGKDSEEGASIQEVIQLVWQKILAAGGAVGGSLGDLGKGALDIGKGAVSSALDAVNAGDAEGAKAALKDAGKSIKDAVKGSGIKDAVKDVKSDKASEALKKAGDNLKDLFK